MKECHSVRHASDHPMDIAQSAMTVKHATVSIIMWAFHLKTCKSKGYTAVCIIVLWVKSMEVRWLVMIFMLNFMKTN
jgi:hypothetical protein